MSEAWSPEEMTPAWMTDTLRRAGAIHEAEVTALDFAPIGQQGQTSRVVRFNLQYDRTERSAPATLIGKFPSDYPAVVELMKTLGNYIREPLFYQTFNTDLGLPAPHCYHAAVELDTHRFVLLLEDMRECRAGGFFVSSPSDVRLAASYLPAFHAKWWNDPRLLAMPFLLQKDDTKTYTGFIDSTLQAIGVCHQLYANDYPESTRRLLERFASVFPRIQAQFLPEAPSVLMHCDFHPKQMFFPTEAGGRFAVFDWQSPAVGVPPGDLARIVATGLSPEDQAVHARPIFDDYFDALLRVGIRGYPREQAELEFRFSTVWSVAITTVAAATTDVSILDAEAKKAGMRWQDYGFGWVDAAARLQDTAGAIEEVLRK